MEKKEAKVKCSGCGSAYKLRIPVTDKPVNFKCKKCGKVLKIKAKSGPETNSAPTTQSAPPPAPELPDMDFGDGMPEFETSQLPDEPDYGGTGQSYQAPPEPPPMYSGAISPGSSLDNQEDELEAPPPPRPSTARSAQSKSMQSPGMADPNQRWMVLADEEVLGPFSDGEVVSMIKSGDITSDTSLRMGERPWIKAMQVAAFRDLFARSNSTSRVGALGDIQMPDTIAGEAGPSGPEFHEELPTIFPFPLKGAQAFGIFAGIAFILMTLLSFSFLLGLPFCIIGWIILYGYLTNLLEASSSGSEGPPQWDFAAMQAIAANGANVFLILLLFTLLPMGLFLLLTIVFFLNYMNMLGYIFLILTMAVFLGAMFIVPASLVLYGASGSLGIALDPSRALGLVKKGGKAYTMLAVISVGVGFACMLITIANVFISDIPLIGFVIAGLLSALVLSYGHFIWFHALGRFTGENSEVTNRVMSGVLT